MKILVIGKTGQLARELARAKLPKGWTAEFAGRADADLADPASAVAAIAMHAPGLVINAAAYTAVDRAENQTDLAHKVNALSPAAMAEACAKRDVPFVTLSTDYVFDGSKAGPYIETDPVSPLGAYGRSKAEGERLVRQVNDLHLILRTSWVFSPFGANFVRTMMRLGAERSLVSVVADQHGRPTAACDLARAVIAAAEALTRDRRAAGTYHVANAGATTWHDFAVAIFKGAMARGARSPETVRPIATADYPTAARRPANAVLACMKFERTFAVTLRGWREALDEVLDELLEPTSAAAS